MTNRNKEIRDSKTFSKLLSSIIIGIILLGAVILGIAGFIYFNASQKPLDPGNKTVTKVEVLPGETATMIGEKLEKKKIIKNSKMFKYYLKFNNISNFPGRKL